MSLPRSTVSEPIIIYEANMIALIVTALVFAGIAGAIFRVDILSLLSLLPWFPGVPKIKKLDERIETLGSIRPSESRSADSKHT